MNSDQGKLFIGGISWETTEEKLKDYFAAYGELSEAVIMKDRATGRARGFGFIVFKDPSVADMVVLQKHNIDGRMVEAKKAVPREEQQSVNRNAVTGNGINMVPSKTKKIFVGGLASTCTESDFRVYFGQFGTITDVVVMYDHGTQRPRGFGFITYDSEDAVDRVLQTTFHKLNDKMVEVKRAVPKDMSSGSSRSNVGLNAGAGRSGSYGIGYGYPYSSSLLPSYGMGMGMDARFIPSPSNRTSFSSFGTMGYPEFGSSNNGKQGFATYGNSGIYRSSSFGGFSGVNVGYGRLGDSDSINYGSPRRNVWSTGGPSFGRSEGIGASAGFNPNVVGTWSSSPSLSSSNSSSMYASNIYGGYRGGNFVSSNSTPAAYGRQNDEHESSLGNLSGNRWGLGSHTLFGDLYGSSGYSDSTWRMTPTDALNYARAGSGGFRSDGFSSNSIIGSEDDLSATDGAYGASGRQSFRGVPV